jgi:hypothetical protein
VRTHWTFMQTEHCLTPAFHVKHDALQHHGGFLARSEAEASSVMFVDTATSPRGDWWQRSRSSAGGPHTQLVSRETYGHECRNQPVRPSPRRLTSRRSWCRAAGRRPLSTLRPDYPLRPEDQRTHVIAAGTSGQAWPGAVDRDETRPALLSDDRVSDTPSSDHIRDSTKCST